MGELSIDDILPGPPGQPIFVRFTYDLNGILEVEAMVENTGRKPQLVLTSNIATLTDAEVDDAVRNMQKLKFYPREDLGNQHLLLYCERIIGEANPHEREALEEALTMYEPPLNSSDRELFDHARTGLLIVLSALGFEYAESEGHDDAAE